MRNIYLPDSKVGFRILVLPNYLAAYKSIHGCWITPHTARHCLIAICDLGFTDRAGFSLMCYHIRRLFTNRTHVQRYRHLSFYECSRYIVVSLIHLPIDRRPVASLVGLFLHPQTVESGVAHLEVSPLPYHMGDGGRNRLDCY